MARCESCGRVLVQGDWPWPCDGSGDHTTHGGLEIKAIHPSERTVILENPRTGEIRFPPTTGPMHPKYAAQGFLRKELTTHAELRAFERETGRLHERSHYDPGSGRSERELASHTQGPEPKLPD